MRVAFLVTGICQVRGSKSTPDSASPEAHCASLRILADPSLNIQRVAVQLEYFRELIERAIGQLAAIVREVVSGRWLRWLRLRFLLKRPQNSF
jgi:hypothetical protein